MVDEQLGRRSLYRAENLLFRASPHSEIIPKPERVLCIVKIEHGNEGWKNFDNSRAARANDLWVSLRPVQMPGDLKPIFSSCFENASQPENVK